MLKIASFKCENSKNHIVTDSLNPSFSFYVESDNKDVFIKEAYITINNWKKRIDNPLNIVYEGESLIPFTKYEAKLDIVDNYNNQDSKTITFETGFLNESWSAKWISDKSYVFKEKKISPKVMVFKKDLSLQKKVKSAKAYVTALGIYDLLIDEKKVGQRYFAPGFTSYKTNLQYQTYDITDVLKENSSINVIVAGGWAVGSFVFTRQNRITTNRQALLFEMHVEYDDGSKEIIVSDDSWKVSEDGPHLMADFYDGETYDANVSLESLNYHNASIEKVKIKPNIIAEYGNGVIRHEVMKPVSVSKLKDDKLIYDFGQNFAGVVNLKIKSAKKGQKIVIKHAEVLNKDGDLNTVFLRSAKATLTYITKKGEQEYSPTFTYMGFRYISVEGIDEKDIDIEAYAIYSDIEEIGKFECSNELLNKLQSNITWSAKSNFVDIPTDCPQRDERMGWTGDIALFSPTATFNFEMTRFLNKWLKDVKAEQLKTGGIPNTVPVQGYGFPATMPTMAIDFWGDACILVPYAQYLAKGDKYVLENMYETMKKYVNACAYWARFLSFEKNRYIWNTLPVFHFGDWVAADVDKMSEWQKRSKWTATASLCNTSGLVAKIAKILNKEEDYKYYSKLSNKVADAYVSKLTDGNGKLLNEFQTAYVLPLYYDMFDKEAKQNAAKNLMELVKKNDYCIGTGFPGTPYILFALADNGYKNDAFKMLLNTKCPSWLYEVKVGGTTIWERWDGLNENGECEIGDDGTGGMISFNHYASGAVGDFLYRRIAGIEILEPGYKKYKVQPLMGGNITYAKAETISPYGLLSSSWKIENQIFKLEVKVPVGCSCEVILPSGNKKILNSGTYSFEESYVS